MNFTLNPLVLFSSLIMGSISAYMGHRRGHSPYLWFMIGFFFGLFGLFAIFFISSKKKAAQKEKKVPVYTLVGPSDKFWYYLDAEQKQWGPMSQMAILQALKEGKITLSTYVWHEELTDWKTLSENLKIEESGALSPDSH